MNAAINSASVAGRPTIWRRSRAYKRKIMQRILFGLPIVMTLGWEYRVWKRKLYYERNRYHFPGSTYFYGKMWGYESDSMIESSLKEGDMVFWSGDPLSFHLHEAILRFPYRRIKGDYDSWDFVGFIKKRDTDGSIMVVGPDGASVSYSDLVADYRTLTLAVRSLIDTSDGGQSRAKIVDSLSDASPGQYLKISPRTIAESSLKAVIRKFSSFKFLGSFIRPQMTMYPMDLIGATQNGEMVEISDVFMDPLVVDSQRISYSPPFFVRRLDNEYYNHNRTKNVVVDWNMLQQRDFKNRLVSPKD
jgi:hypothetical protein